MSKYETNKLNVPKLDLFKDSTNEFLRNIYETAKKYVLSDKQVAAANRAAEKVFDPGYKDPWLENCAKIDGLRELGEDSIDSEFIAELYRNSKKYVLSDKQAVYLQKFIDGKRKVVILSNKEAKAILTVCGRMTSFSDVASYFVHGALSMTIRSAPDKDTFITGNEYEALLRMGNKYKKSIFSTMFGDK